MGLAQNVVIVHKVLKIATELEITKMCGYQVPHFLFNFHSWICPEIPNPQLH